MDKWTKEEAQKNHLCIGLLAHVDAGKTTLSEALLYECKEIASFGRVDKQDSFLDENKMERERGITIFSKQAFLHYKDMEIALLDTPGHIDFSAEMERILPVLDYAILLINGADGIQSHTRTLIHLLDAYKIVTFVFINKMDHPFADKEVLLSACNKEFSGYFVDFSESNQDDFFEHIAFAQENLLEEYLENKMISQESIKEEIHKRTLVPCFFGSALKQEGIVDLLEGLLRYTRPFCAKNTFSGKVYKITRDEDGTRLTHLKVTGEELKVKQVIKQEKNGLYWEEKINQIRKYSGNKYQIVSTLLPGEIGAVTGLNKTYAGEGLGEEQDSDKMITQPVLLYQLSFSQETSRFMVMEKLKLLLEEDPMLSIQYSEETKEITCAVMGEIQIQVLKALLWDRFQLKVEFTQGSILYRETIANKVEGVGHFEPFKHYAEVHLLLEPGKRGSGIAIRNTCSLEQLSLPFQKQVLFQLKETKFKGVLTGSEITDIIITLISGKAHLKHTMGGDFRQATERALRQGLMKAESLLLEPVYQYTLNLPEENLGRAYFDLEQMSGVALPVEMMDHKATLKGQAPVAKMKNYQQDVLTYTKGEGIITLELGGYQVCHNKDEVIQSRNYNPLVDEEHPTGSIFCSHGEGFLVSWDQVENYMHLPLVVEEELIINEVKRLNGRQEVEKEIWLGVEEIDEILERTYCANKGINPKKQQFKKKNIASYESLSTKKMVCQQKKEPYLLVDGYNIIFSWKELNEVAKVSLDGARGKLLDILSNYQGHKNIKVIVVFDAYQVKGHTTEYSNYHNIYQVFTKEAETADAYIEKFTHENSNQYDILVATSDRLEQMIIQGEGSRKISALDFYQEVKETENRILEAIEHQRDSKGVHLENYLPSEVTTFQIKKPLL